MSLPDGDDEKDIWGRERVMHAEAERHLLKLEGVGGVTGM